MSQTSRKLSASHNHQPVRPPPFRCVVNASRRRMHSRESSFAAYDLSTDESVFEGNFVRPMKNISDEQQRVLESGKRNAYLTLRYDHSPDTKYYYPEATSWRYGWLHNVQCKKGKHKLNYQISASFKCKYMPRMEKSDSRLHSIINLKKTSARSRRSSLSSSVSNNSTSDM